MSAEYPVFASLKGKRILVSGASGFLGKAIVQALSENGSQVRGLVRSRERSAVLEQWPGVKIIKGDIKNADSMMESVLGCQYVIHCAAKLSGDWEECYAVNVCGTENLARAAFTAGCRCFLHISSVVVCGYDVTGEVDESTPLAPANDAYSLSKAAAELALREIAEQSGFPYCIIRPGAIYGPEARLWTEQLFRLARRPILPFMGTGKGSIAAIYVRDVVDICLLAIASDQAIGEIFFATPYPSPRWREFLLAYASLCGGTRWLSIPLAMVRLLAKLSTLGAPAGSLRSLLPVLVDYANRPLNYRNDKARMSLNWRPRVSLAEGVQRCRPWLSERGLLGCGESREIHHL